MSDSLILVGLSGGVDSAVAALRLLEQGHRVRGVFMKNWEEDDATGYCAAEEDLNDAQRVADHLGIELQRVNFAHDYWERVFQEFLQEYQSGRTPNPDILCNSEIKFRAFLDYARDHGANGIATGHYVRRRDHNGAVQLLKGLDPNKDQSYFLHRLTQEQLRDAWFPVGELEKTAVREIARKANLPNAERKDSTGLCFIGERNFKPFLQRFLAPQPGPIVDPDNKVLGEHEGLAFYTLGQRRGLGIGGQKEGSEEAWYVAAKRMDHNTLVVAQGEDHPWLFCSQATTESAHWISGDAPAFPHACQAKVRYRQGDQAVEIHAADNATLELHFTEPQRAVTPGQSAVFYDGEVCLGGAVLHHTNTPAR